MTAALGVYGGLALAAFIAATLLPAQSEAVLAGLVIGTDHPAWALVLAAGLGNVAGSLVNYALGRGLARLRGKPWFPVPEAALARAQRWYAKGGRWVLLLAWLPVVGDPLTAVAGVMRERLWVFIPLVAIGKFGRYAAVAWLAAQY